MLVLVLSVINKGNLLTEWRTVLSVIIIGVVKQNRGNPICLIAFMTADKTGRHEVLLSNQS